MVCPDAVAFPVAGQNQAGLEKSLEVLEQAVVLAEPGGMIRPFVELGPAMADLLKCLPEQTVAPDHIKKILSDFDGFQPETVPGASAHDIPSPSAPTPQPLVETLSNRELEVLDLLAERLQSKEIAEKLFISPHTVRTHLKNIYQKLNVGGRRQAVARAMDLGILPSR